MTLAELRGSLVDKRCTFREPFRRRYFGRITGVAPDTSGGVWVYIHVAGQKTDHRGMVCGGYFHLPLSILELEC